MKKYNLPVEKIVKFLYRGEIHRINPEDMGEFYPNPVLAKIFTNSFMAQNKYEISYEEIEKEETRLGIKFPQILKKYYHECGDLDINNCFSEILNLEDIEFSHTWLKEGLEDEGYSDDEIEKILKETDDFLIFWTENQGVWNAGIKKEDLGLENPPVYITVNDDLYSWQKITDGIDSFIIGQVIDNLQDSRFYFLSFDNEQIDSILSEEKISIDELRNGTLEIKDTRIKFSTYADYGNDKIYIFKLRNEKIEKCWLIKPKVKKDRSSYADGVLLKIADIITFNDREIVKRLEIVLEDFHNYLRDNINFRYIDEEINSLSIKEKVELKVSVMIMLLCENNYLCCLDWKCELEDFKIFSDVLKKVGIDENICNFEELDFDEDDDIEAWSKKFNEVFGKKNIFVGNINTDSDSYSIFPATKKKIEELKKLGDKIGIGIDFLSYSEERKNE